MKLWHLFLLCAAALLLVVCWYALEPTARESLQRPLAAASELPKPQSPAPQGTSVTSQPVRTPQVALPSKSAQAPRQVPGSGDAPVENPQKRASNNPLSPASAPVVMPISLQPADPNAEVEMHQVTRMFRDFRTLMGENPVGSNAEIMSAVMGDNPRRATLGPPEGLSLNGNGELVDHWGTPFFFHQLSADLMEIRSAGPDRRMYTEDDIVTK